MSWSTVMLLVLANIPTSFQHESALVPQCRKVLDHKRCKILGKILSASGVLSHRVQLLQVVEAIPRYDLVPAFPAQEVLLAGSTFQNARSGCSTVNVRVASVRVATVRVAMASVRVASCTRPDRRNLASWLLNGPIKCISVNLASQST